MLFCRGVFFWGGIWQQCSSALLVFRLLDGDSRGDFRLLAGDDRGAYIVPHEAALAM